LCVYLLNPNQKAKRLEKNTFHCSKHAIINAAADILHEKKFYIVEINDKAGLILAEQGVSMTSLGKAVTIRIEPKEAEMVVSVSCSHRFKFGFPGSTSAVEKKIMNQLIKDL